MNKIFLLIDSDKNVVAIYDDEAVAIKMREPLEAKLNLKLVVEKRSVNQDIKMIGLVK